MKRKEGPHSRTTAKDDAPDWWINAHNDSLRFGTGVILVHSDKGPEHVPLERYPELADALTTSYAQQNTK